MPLQGDNKIIEMKYAGKPFAKMTEDEDAIDEYERNEAIEFSKYLHKNFMSWDEGGQYNWKAHDDKIGVISFTHAYEYFLQSKP